MNQLTQPIKWHGGKGAFNGKLAKWIISLMPKHTHYVEPFFGGGSVLLHKDPEGVSEVVNDIHFQLMEFWSVLRSEEWFEKFKRMVEAVPFSQEMFEGCAADKAQWHFEDHVVNNAVRFFVRARQSRQGLMKDFATLSRTRTRSGMNEQVSAWLTAIDGLPDVHARLKRVVILNRDALDVIRQQDGVDTCFYLDPTYLHETRATKADYKHEMTREQHSELLEVLSKIKGKFLLSGYASMLYDIATVEHGWNLHRFDIVNNASSKQVKDVKSEFLWTNF